jgi:polyhydroxybutyrate depolymerase
MQDRFAAFASVSATGAFRLPDICAEQDTIPAMYIHGTADNIVPWDGLSSVNDAGEEVLVSASMSQTIGFWAGHNGCGADLDIVDIPLSTTETQTRILNVTDCPEDAPVVVYMVVNGGHTWHGVLGNSDLLGLSSQDFNASEVIWEFFSQFPLQ